MVRLAIYMAQAMRKRRTHENPQVRVEMNRLTAHFPALRGAKKL